jgi:hypothetical protein
MRVLAARFSDRRIASAVIELLQRRLHVAAPDVDIAPLGMPGQPSANDTLLAGRFSDAQAPEVAQMVRDAGGEMVANIDEILTRPRVIPRREEWNRTLKRNGLHA